MVRPLPDLTPDDILARTQSAGHHGRPVRKDEIELPERGLYIESWLPERRSRRKPILFVHGMFGGSWVWERHLGYFAGRGWEGHALNLRNHFWSDPADPAELSFDTYLEDVVAAASHFGPDVVLAGHGMGALLSLKAAERVKVSGLILLAPELPRDLREDVRAHEVRAIPEAIGRSTIGWEMLPERLQREHADLTLADVLRIQHLLGQKPREAGAARRQVLQGISVDRSAIEGVPRLVIGAGLDRYVSEESVERLAEWLDAAYEPFGAHSHFGLVLAENGYAQVAEAIRSFLELNRL